ncbi:MAG: outer membrane protein assembly factor BamB [Verrucomicrobiales bacterium]|jgi:outer membrane protein assembly factor BamB
MKYLALWITLLVTTNAAAGDWPQWMGADREGIWKETGIIEKFPEGGPKVLWRTPINNGYSGPAIVGDRVYVMDREISDTTKVPDNAFKRGEIPGNERVLCLDAGNGKIIWERTYDCNYTVSYASGPRATPTVDGERVYTLGAEGDLLCLNTADGKIKWQHDFKNLFEIKAPTWGFTASPLVDGDLLICLARGDGTTAVAFDKLTGEKKWSALSAREPGYAPPKIIEHNGKRLLILWHPESVNALDPQTGKIHWTVEWKLRSGLSVATPRLRGDRLFFSCFYNGSMMLKLNAGNAQPAILWRTEKVTENPVRTEHLNGIMSTPVFTGDHIYGACSYGEFRCLEAETGERLWESLEPIALEKPTRWGNVFITQHADRYFLFTEKGDLVIANLSPEGYEEIDRAHLIEPNGTDMRQRKIVWSHPAYARRSCFIRNDSEIICVSLAKP